MHMSNIIWRDIHWYQILSAVLGLGMFLYFAWGLIEYSSSFDIFLNSLSLIVTLMCLYFFIATIMTKLTYITSDGVRIGNAPNDMYSSIRLGPAPFLKWKDITSLKIQKKAVRHGWVALLVPFLIVRTKGKTYKTFLARPVAFQLTLKRLHKDHLLSKSSN